MWRNKRKTIEADAADNIVQHMKVISKLASQSLGKSQGPVALRLYCIILKGKCKGL